MSDLTNAKKRKLERVFGMASGYVLNLHCDKIKKKGARMIKKKMLLLSVVFFCVMVCVSSVCVAQDAEKLNLNSLMESPYVPIIVFSVVLFLIGYIIFVTIIRPKKKISDTLANSVTIGFSCVEKDSSDWRRVTDFLTGSFAEDAQLGGSYEFFIKEIHKSDKYNEFVVLFQNIITQEVPFGKSGRYSAINWPSALMIVVIEPTVIEHSVFIRSNFGGFKIIPGTIVGRGKSTKQLEQQGIKVQEITDGLSNEFQKDHYAYALCSVGSFVAMSIPQRLQEVFIRCANQSHVKTYECSNFDDFGGYVKLMRNGFVVPIASRNRPRDVDALQRISAFVKDVFTAVNSK
jgi:hypothetical protein